MSKKVFLSAGHGGKDPGACAYGMKEKDINLQIMLACKSELERHGLTVICSRLKDENDPVTEEAKEANASGADIAASFHTNAFRGEGSTADGSETYYYPGSDNGKRLAELCEKHVQLIGQNSRGIVERPNLHFLRKTTMPAVLCECAFIDCDKDNNIIDTVAEQQAFGKAYAKAILEYFDIDYKAPGAAVDNKTVEVQPAMSFNKAYADTYTVTTDDLKLRAGANTKYAELASMPKGAKVQNYGYYTKESDGTVWLYVVYNGKVGFASKRYLKA